MQNCYGLLQEAISPKWVEVYKSPRQIPIEQQIGELQQKLEQIQQELTKAQTNLKTESRFQKLLYEQGDVLEIVVRDALAELGAKVDEPQQRGREDGRLVDPLGRRYVIEIKGRSNQLRLADVRQLDQWVGDVIINEGLNCKGLLIANTYCDTPLEQRGEPYPPNCIQASITRSYCLISTTQILYAVFAAQRNELDLTSFWETVFNTAGICNLPSLPILNNN